MQRPLNSRSVLERATDFMATTRETTRKKAAKARTFVHEKPLLSAFLSLGAGLFLGMMINRPRVIVIKAKGGLR